MKGIDLYNIIAFSTPSCSSLLILIMLGWDMTNVNRLHRSSKKWLFLFFVSLAINELIPIFYYYTPAWYVYINWLSYSVMFIMPVLSYRFLFEITRIKAGEHFHWLHYAFPIVASLLALILTAIVPYSEQYSVVSCRNSDIAITSLFSLMFVSKILVKSVIGMIYFTACFIRFIRYRRIVIKFTSDRSKASLRWMYRYLALVLILTVLLLIVFIGSRSTYYSSPLATSPLFFLAFLQLNIAYHTLRDNYIVLEPLPDETVPEKEDLPESPDPKKDRLTKTFFEEYIRTRKPYLNPDLKITDLVNDLDMNRTYISRFINREYGINFSRYINGCRLDEYRRLLDDPSTKDKSGEELAELVGFSSYRYFLRLMNHAETSKALKR